MTARTELLHSGLRLLIQDQKNVRNIYEVWNAHEEIQEYTVIAPLIAKVHRRLQRDLDRLHLLWGSYPAPDDGQDPVPDAHPHTDTPNRPSPSNVLRTPPMWDIADVLRQGYDALDKLSVRYASLYSLAMAVSEPPVANIAYSNLTGIRELMSELTGILPLVAVDEDTPSPPAPDRPTDSDPLPPRHMERRSEMSPVDPDAEEAELVSSSAAE